MPANLQAHIKLIHSGQEFLCEFCDYRAKNQIYLKAHIGNKHTDRKPGAEGTARNEKKYICDKCTFKTGYRPKLDEHIQNIHGINELYCEQCDFSTMLPKVK